MRKIGVILLALIVSIFTFNGNEIYKKDIRNRLVIQGIGIDVEKDGYIVTIQAIDTNAQSASSSDGASQPPLKTFDVKGETIYTAIKSVTELEGKLPLYSQNRIIILGKSITEENMDNVIDFFVRDVENSSSVCIAAAEKTASEILKAKNGEEYISARNIQIAINSSEYDGRIFRMQLYDLINRYNSGTRDFAIPMLSVVEKDKEKSVEIIGTALFNNTKYREKISKEETVFLNMMYDRIHNSALSYEYEEDKSVSLNIVEAKTTRKVRMENGKPIFSATISLKADIAEVNGGVSSEMKMVEIERISKKGEDFIKDETQKLIHKMYNEFNSDAVGLARLLYIWETDFYKTNEKNLDFVLQNSAYEVEVNLEIRRIGHEFVV